LHLPSFPTRRSSDLLVALTSVVRAPGIGEGAQRFEEDDEVGLLSRRKVEGLPGAPVLRAQARGIDAGVVAHDLREGLYAAVAAVDRKSTRLNSSHLG